MKTYLIINQSSVVSSDQLSKMITAINILLTTLCSDWSLEAMQLVKVSAVTKVSNTIYILDNTDSPGALGYHYEVNGNAVAKVFAKTIINYGGVVLYKDKVTMTVAQCLCHELLEMIGNSTINKWYLDNNGTFWAGELSDAVQNNLIVINLPNSVKVGLSDYVLPSYFSPNTIVGPFNKLNTLKAPFTVDKSGYAIIIQGNSIVAIYGSSVTEQKKIDVEKDITEIKLSNKLFQ